LSDLQTDMASPILSIETTLVYLSRTV